MRFSPLTVLFLVLFLLIASSPAQVEYIVKYNSSSTASEINQRLEDGNWYIGSNRAASPKTLTGFSMLYPHSKTQKLPASFATLNFADSLTSNELASITASDPSIEYMEPNNSLAVHFVPNDSLLGQQWALQKINAFAAWDITSGSDTILVGVIDTGIDYHHPDLKEKVFTNHGESGFDSEGNNKQQNGIDDDGNGFVDDFMGWDFTDRSFLEINSSIGDFTGWDNDPLDDNFGSHGTAVSGIIAAQVNNAIGIAGAAPEVKILPLRAFDAEGYGDEGDVAAAVLYAVEMGCDVINMSFGDVSYSLVLRDVLRYAYERGVTLVASAGNSSSSDPHYPSGFREVISVSNSTVDDYIATTSNFGSTVDIAAPGTGIMTTIRTEHGSYAEVNGTSAAAPFVSAAAALLHSSGTFTNEEIKQVLKSTAVDIGPPGWDERSAAGRLDMELALSIAAPAVTSFNYPPMDHSEHDDTLGVYVTVLNPYFQSFEVDFGIGYLPDDWTMLGEMQLKQVRNKKIGIIETSGLPDTIYTLRITAYQHNGITAEERTHFSIHRNAPEAALLTVSPAIIGRKQTIFASTTSERNAVVSMHYRSASMDGFRTVSLDGFSKNNKFVKSRHFGFIPPGEVQIAGEYEIYFSAVDEGGLETVFGDTTLYLKPVFNLSSPVDLSYTLPAGDLFGEALSLSGVSANEVVIRGVESPGISQLFAFENGDFVLIDEEFLDQQIIADAGDFNGNGLTDILALWTYQTIFLEAEGSGSTAFLPQYTSGEEFIWPITTTDIGSNGVYELIAFSSDTAISIYSIEQNLAPSLLTTLQNFSPKGFGGNAFNAADGVVADTDGDGIDEFWCIDMDGDILAYDLYTATDVREKSLVTTGFAGNSAEIAKGDYDGDGIDDIAVVLESIQARDIAPVDYLVVFNLLNDSVNFLLQQAFLDRNRDFLLYNGNNRLEFHDLDDKGADELVVFAFPDAFVFSGTEGENEILFERGGVNASSILIADFNGNMVPEIALPGANEISFVELREQRVYVSGLRAERTDQAMPSLSWNPLLDTDIYYLYRAAGEDNFTCIDSTTETSYIDASALEGTEYLYAVTAKPLGDTLINRLYAVDINNLKPALLRRIEVVKNNSLSVTFDSPVPGIPSTTEYFVLNSQFTPETISPLSQYSYLLSFKEDFRNGENQLSISRISGEGGISIANTVVSFEYHPAAVVEEMHIVSYEVVDEYRIAITFNMPLDPLQAATVSNYQFSPDNAAAESRVTAGDPNTVMINLEGAGNPVGSIGREYRLTVSGIRSTAATGSVPVVEGAGATIVLSSNTENLDDVYVYPNPVRADWQAQITFANLPQFAEITVFNLNGEHIRTIEKYAGNGGVEWDLRDSGGSVLPTGVYLYYVRQLDSQGDETSNTKGKFTIIR